MDTVLSRQAELTAQRVDAAAVGFDPATILSILMQVLPLLVGCFTRNSDPAETSARFRAYATNHPTECRRRTARRIRGEADEPMTREQSFALADAVIAQAFEVEPEVAAECCVYAVG